MDLTIEEKILNIKNLSKNLDLKKIDSILYGMTDEIVSIYFVNGGWKKFCITDENKYKNLIKYLKENQTEPNYYTVDEIGRIWEYYKNDVKNNKTTLGFFNYFKKFDKTFKR